MIFFTKAKKATLPKGKRPDGDMFVAFANLPNPYKQPDKNRPGIDEYINRLAELRRTPVRMLQEAVQILTSYNRMVLKPEQRLELADRVLGQVYPVLAILVKQQNFTISSLPETRERATELTACVDATEQLAMSYKHVFKHEFSVKPAMYKKNRECLYHVGFRILELIRVSQRFRAWRYQKLPHNEWQDCNQVFFSLVLHNDVDEELKLIGTIGTYIKNAKEGVKPALHSSVHKLYLSIQLIGVLDITTWPLRLFQVPDAYLEYYPDDIKIVADDGQELQPGWLITFLGNTNPALFQRYEKMPSPAIRFNCVDLYARLVRDHEELARMKFLKKNDPSGLSRPLIELEDKERQPFLELMLLALQKKQRRQKRHPVFEHEKLRVYFGLKDVMKLLLDMFAPDLRRNIANRRFVDTLAQSSSVLASDDRSYMSTGWKIENFSAGGMLLSTEATGFTHPIQVGQLVAVLNVAEEMDQHQYVPQAVKEKLNTPIVGFVCRLNRPHDRLVEVGMMRLAMRIEAAVIDADGSKIPNDIRVLLYQDFDQEWKLIAPQQQGLIAGTPCKLTRTDGSQILVRLGDIWLTKAEFEVFEVRSPDLK